MALGYGLVLDADLPHLYVGLMAEVRDRVEKRAAGLRRSLYRRSQTREAARPLYWISSSMSQQ